MADPITLTTVGVTALSEGVKFFYAQAGELIRRWLDARKQRPQTVERLQVALPEALGGEALQFALDVAVLDEVGEPLRSLRQLLSEYSDGIRAISREDRGLLETVDRMRKILEVVYRRELTFAGEDCTGSGPIVHGSLDAAVILGKAAAIRADYVRGGHISGTVTADTLASTSDVVAVEVKTVG